MFREVENKGRYKTAQGYNCHIRDKEIDYLFTDSALQEAKKRADKNPEDIPEEIAVPYDGYLTGLATGLIVGFVVTAASYFALKYFIGI